MKFENLNSWQEARFLVKNIYSLTRSKPLEKDFKLCSQIQSAAVSIMSNIAESFERLHLPEKIQFYNTARSSCGEVRSLLFVVADNYSESSLMALEIMPLTESVGKLISGLIFSTQCRKKAPISHLPSSIS